MARLPLGSAIHDCWTNGQKILLDTGGPLMEAVTVREREN